MVSERVRLIEPGWIERRDHGSGVFTVWWPSGAIGIEHDCKVIEGTQLVTAPRLQLDGGHMVVVRAPLTVEPSIACDCGLHGYIRKGVWCPV